MTYLIRYSCTCETRQTRRHSPNSLPRTRQTRRHSPNHLPSTRQTRRHSPSRLPSTRRTRRHSPKAISEKNVTRFDTFARVIRHFGEFGASGHCLLITHFATGKVSFEFFKKKPFNKLQFPYQFCLKTFSIHFISEIFLCFSVFDRQPVGQC
jgi:hypothetical protein